jgi:hypothetical protein
MTTPQVEAPATPLFSGVFRLPARGYRERAMQHIFKSLAIGSALVAVTTVSLPAPAKADTASTLLIAAGAAAIVGALLTDSNNHPYYVSNNRRYYVTQNEATYYRSHHQGVQRQAWVPENEYPVQRNAGYSMQRQQSAHSMGQQRNQGQGNQNRGH